MRHYLIEASYFVASILFILGLRGLSHPETARRGMHLAEFGMLMAIIGTLMHQEIVSYEWIIAGLLLGSAIGTGIGLWVPMTAMPQRTAFSHAFGALCGFAGRHFGILFARRQPRQVYDGSDRFRRIAGVIDSDRQSGGVRQVAGNAARQANDL